MVGLLGGKRVYLLVDETKLGKRMGIMLVGLAFERRCIPLAWRCYRANDASAYPPEGQVGLIASLLGQILAGMPADRGIGTSPKLCQAIARLGWFYLLRVTSQSKICTETGEYTVAHMAQPGECWTAKGLIFKKNGRLRARACTYWGMDYREPWALVTNHPDLTGLEYAVRNWQEQAFRDLKSGGWQWGDCRVRRPDHMERLLVLLTLAYAWVIALGCHAIEADHAKPLVRNPGGSARRYWSLFKEGLHFFINVVCRLSRFFPLYFTPDARFT